MAERNLSVMQNHEVDLVSETRLRMVRDKFANGAPADEFNLFIAFCKTKNLDPLQRQVYLIPRSTKDANGNYTKSWTIQTSIDGYRAIADRTGAYAGSDDAVFTESGQKVRSGTGDWATDKPRPDTAKVTVWKMVQLQRCPFTATARWDEYYQEKSPLWGKMPHTMLSKCAESLALRKAFPEQLSGVYTSDEMEQAGMPVEVAPRPSETTTRRVTPVASVRGHVDVDTGEIIEAQSRPVNNDRDKASRTFFAVCTARGFTDDANRLLAFATFPEREHGRTTSRKELTGKELIDLAAFITDNTTQAYDDDGEEIPMPDPNVEYANQIAAAQDQRRLAEIGAKMKDGGISADWLRTMYAYRNREVPTVADEAAS